ncbi:MAG: insulinase family protein [Oscillospiraceae bacterium]|jgi:predicted Zn-dependent peptidase|nr:insulinase family protein [Oscillospiraceae bacterium]
MHEKVTLPNGVRLLFEEIPYVSSAAAGIWVGSGSRHEPRALSGISHAIEHMVFKGTQTRTAAQIAAAMDAIGGQVNAFTTKECTSFYVRALEAHLPQALDVLTDLFFAPRIAPADWETERGVILEEIGMYEDTPEDLVTERLFGSVFRGCALGRPILGAAGTLGRMSARQIARYKEEHYRAGGIVVSLCGRYAPRDRETLLERFAALPPAPALDASPAVLAPAFTTRRKDIEQNHLCLAWPALPYGSPARYAQQVLSNILGGGMSSRLFQQVREERGLCYSIYSFASGHEDAGLFAIYTALSRETEREALGLIAGVVRRFVEDGPDDSELERAREQVKANVLMGMESISARMNNLGRNELLLGEVKTQDEVVAAYNGVTKEAVWDLARRIFVPEKLCFSAVGRVSAAGRYEELLGGA